MSRPTTSARPARRPAVILACLAVLAAATMAASAAAQETAPRGQATDPPPAEPGIIPVGPPASPQTEAAVREQLDEAPASAPQEEASAAEPADRDPVRMLLDEIDRLNREILTLRRDLAQARLEAAGATRELEDLRRFLQDNDRLGDDFTQYRSVLETQQRQSRDQQLQEMRERYEREKADRLARIQEARSRRAEERAERDRLASYRRRGFSPLGLDVFVSQMAYSYHSTDTTAARIDYAFGLGNYLRVYPGASIDFSRMTISGSVLNASEQTRNVGMAITFFDEVGNQVGHEIIQVKNARPDVPYPFTSTIQMALDRPFASSTQYVLYADPIE